MATKSFQWASGLSESACTDIIDARSPAEFAEDHVPGAINLPVLNDAERAQIGALHKHDSFAARKQGAALISRNIAHMLEGPLRSKTGGFFPTVYCWRGGMRSQSLGIILAQVGFRVAVLEGGYKRYRHQVIENLHQLGASLDLRILAGLTGTAKTAILHRMIHRGFQVIDLEGLANHKGSLLGAPVEGAQPTQKAFESRLAAAMGRLDADRPVWVECESNKIGALHTPEALWKTMQAAPVMEITAPVESRVHYLLRDYDYFCANPAPLKEKVRCLLRIRGHQVVDRWCELIDGERWTTFVEEILVQHYDPTYSRSIERWRQEGNRRYDLPGLEDAHLDAFIDQLAAHHPA